MFIILLLIFRALIFLLNCVGKFQLCCIVFGVRLDCLQNNYCQFELAFFLFLDFDSDDDNNVMSLNGFN